MGKQAVLQTVRRVLTLWNGGLGLMATVLSRWVLGCKRDNEAKLRGLVMRSRATLWEYEVGVGPNATWQEHDPYVAEELEKAEKVERATRWPVLAL